MILEIAHPPGRRAIGDDRRESRTPRRSPLDRTRCEVSQLPKKTAGFPRATRTTHCPCSPMQLRGFTLKGHIDSTRFVPLFTVGSSSAYEHLEILPERLDVGCLTSQKARSEETPNPTLSSSRSSNGNSFGSASKRRN